MKKLIIITLILLFCSFPLHAETNFCHDKKSWKDWNKMIKSYPNDMPLQILHALRIGLCVKVEQNSITFDEAMNLFNDMFDTVVNKRGEEDNAN